MPDGMFIDVEISEDIKTDLDMGNKVVESCPVDIFIIDINLYVIYNQSKNAIFNQLKQINSIKQIFNLNNVNILYENNNWT